MEKMSFINQIYALKVFNGFLWILIGILNCMDNVLGRVIQIIALIFCIACICYVATAEKENSDEMAQENLYKAKAEVLDLMHSGFRICAIAAMLFFSIKTITLDWAEIVPSVFFVVTGIQELAVGLKFKKLERE